MRFDKEGRDNGEISIDIPNRNVVVGCRYAMCITYTAGSKGIATGGCVRFRLPGFRIGENELLPVSCSNPQLKLSCADNLPAIDGMTGREFKFVDCLFVSIEGASLKEGETISFVYGNSGLGVSAPEYAHRWGIEVSTDYDGTRSGPGSGFYLVEDPPVINFISDRAARIEITIPSYTKSSEVFDTVVKIRDRYNNIVPSYRGRIGLKIESCGKICCVKEYEFTEEDGGVHRFDEILFSEEGINRIVVTDEGLGVCARSNPSKTTEKESPCRLFWGETHTHSTVSADTAAFNGLQGRPKDVYAYARDIADLDFCMVTDHSQNLDADEWEETMEAAKTCCEPGKFVTFSAYEATHVPLRQDGDKNVCFFEDDAPCINEGSTKDLYCKLKKLQTKSMVIPHLHSRTNWEMHDPELERVVEIYSHWGCGLAPGNEMDMIPRCGLNPEHYVSHALEQGVKLGFIASADHSYGHPGDDFWWPLSNYNGGLAGVYAPSLTREALWDSIWNRRTYATTRARILLEFEIDGHMMGEEFVGDSGTERRITVNAYGTVSIEKVEIIKNGCLLHTREGKRCLDMEFDWIDREAERETDYYYVHVLQVDGEQAWSSPIWVKTA